MGVGAGLYMYDVVVKKFTFAISSSDEFLSVVGPTDILFTNTFTIVRQGGLLTVFI